VFGHFVGNRNTSSRQSKYNHVITVCVFFELLGEQPPRFGSVYKGSFCDTLIPFLSASHLDAVIELLQAGRSLWKRLHRKLNDLLAAENRPVCSYSIR
jgi:hypothetical protein